jgi:soluble lytic murein transglycosylase-like protein
MPRSPILRALALALIASALGMASVPSSAQVYAGETPSGAVVLSNFQTLETPTVLLAAPLVPVAPAVPVVAATPSVAPVVAPAAVAPLAREAISSIVREVAREVQLSPHLIEAVISVESGYNTRAVSAKGALGLMQLMPATAQRFGVANALDPRENVRGGALYLKWLLGFFGNDLRLALAAYNAGESAVIEAGYRIPPYFETQRYVPRVMDRMRRPVTG